MNLPNYYIKGECMEMCPEAEITLREKERLLHVLETRLGTKGKPVADRKKVVKSFSRSAAGKQLHDPKNLRPPRVLLKTLSYLFEEVMVNERVPWHVTYDFIMDRLRAIRQDMVIQNVSVAESICILQPIVRFYAYAAYKCIDGCTNSAAVCVQHLTPFNKYFDFSFQRLLQVFQMLFFRLCHENISNFDPFINQTHLQECLKRLLCLYDDCDNLFSNTDICGDSYCMKSLSNTRPHFEALYLVLNLGSATALMRALTLPKRWRNKIVKVALALSINYHRNNFIKVCRTITQLPVLLQGLTVVHLPEIRRRALQIMSVAYNSKNLSFPLEVLQDLYLYENFEQVKADCKYYGLKCKQNEVQFLKTDFDGTKAAVPPAHLRCVDEAFRNMNITDLILNG